MVVPLIARGRTLGAITFVSSRGDRRYEEEDLALAEDLARRAALAMDNALLYQETNESKERFAYLARALQESLLPPRIEGIPGIETAVRYRPAAEGNQVGGDFYDIFQTGDNDWSIVVGDVCGKGARAAALTGLARHTIRAVAMRDRRPLKVLSLLNEAILKEDPAQHTPRFCTVAYARLQPTGTGGRVTLSCGGHPLPYVLRGVGSWEQVGITGMPLGMFSDPDLAEETLELSPGDALFLYTDGVTEERNDHAIFGEDRLRDVLAASAGSSADAIGDAVEQAVLEFTTDNATDDIAILVLRIAPES
jgi:serine phosphatase RsbU (regulator of sigma subunit)